jgi:hypothetical protein
MEIILPLFYTFVFLYLMKRLNFFKSSEIAFYQFGAIFLMKILTGLSLWFIYSYHYGIRHSSDAFKYFDDAAVIFESLKTNPLHFLQLITGINADDPELMVYLNDTYSWFKPYDYGIYNDNRTIIRLNALVMLFSWGNYHVHTIFWCFFSMTGLTAIFKFFKNVVSEKKTILIIAVYLLPSMLFWSSGVLKEGILIFGFGMLLYYFNRLLFEKLELRFLFWIVFSFFILVLTKGYVLLAFLPSMASLIVIRFTGKEKAGLKFLLTHLILLLFAANLFRINEDWDVLHYIYQKQKDFLNLAYLENAGSAIELKEFKPEWMSLFLNFPEAISNVLLRPHLLETDSLFMLAAAIENLLIILFTAVCLICFKKPEKGQMVYFWLCVFFSISLAAIIGYITPILGALVRYKIPLLPFVTVAFLLLADKQKFYRTFPFFKKIEKILSQ